MVVRAWGTGRGRLLGMDDRRRRRSGVVADTAVRRWCTGRLVGRNRRRRWSVVATMVVRTRSGGWLVGAMDGSRSWGVLVAIVGRTWSDGGMVGKDRRRSRRWRAVTGLVVVRTRSAGWPAAMNRSGSWSMMMARMTMMTMVVVMRARRRSMMVVVTVVLRERGVGRCLMAFMRKRRRDQQQHCHHSGHRRRDRDGHGEKLEECWHLDLIVLWGVAIVVDKHAYLYRIANGRFGRMGY